MRFHTFDTSYATKEKGDTRGFGKNRRHESFHDIFED